MREYTATGEINGDGDKLQAVGKLRVQVSKSNSSIGRYEKTTRVHQALDPVAAEEEDIAGESRFQS